MDGRDIVTVILAVLGLLGGAFGVKFLDRWFDRERRRSELADKTEGLVFADNEQARIWLRQQLDERDDELKVVRENERKLLSEVGKLAAQVARQEALLTAQGQQIVELRAAVERQGESYAKAAAERDLFREKVTDLTARLATESSLRQLLEKDILARDIEIEHLSDRIKTLRGGG